MTTIRDAVPEDGPQLIALFRQAPMRAGTEFVLDRGPDFQALLRLRGRFRTFVATRGDRILGSVTALWHERRDLGGTVRVCELVDLRVAPDARGGATAARLLGRAARALEETPADWVLCLIGDRNRDAARLVTGGLGFPALKALARYASVHYPVWRAGTAGARGMTVVRATDRDGALLATLVRVTASGRRFSPPELFPWPDPAGAHYGWIAQDGSCALGGLVVWDGNAVRRIRVMRYSGGDRLFRGATLVAGLFGAATPLPPPGEPLRLWASRWLGVREANPRVTGALVRAALRAAAGAGQHVLQVNLEEHDPLLGALPSLPRSVYWSTLYGLATGRRAGEDAPGVLCHADLALV
ncbi:MAG: N-acetyltransferase family protein [Deltaproteobacteria bacterium]